MSTTFILWHITNKSIPDSPPPPATLMHREKPSNEASLIPPSVMSSFAHNSQDWVDRSGQPRISQNIQDFIPDSHSSCNVLGCPATPQEGKAY